MTIGETTNTTGSDPGPTLARRGLMLGAGVAALAAGTLAGKLPATADPREPKAKEQSEVLHAAAQQLSPVSSTAGSPAISGYTYRHASWLDFHPESGPGYRRYGGRGVYSSGVSPYLWATVEIPAGALVRDIEWYVYNNSGSAVTGFARMWAAGTGSLFATLADTTINTGTTTQSRRSVVSSVNYGPHPLGTKIALGLETNINNDNVQINGARVGFTQGSGAVGMLPTPVRLYDSRVTGGKLTANTVRTITLPAAYIRPGTSGLVVNIAAVTPAAGGNLKVYPGNVAQPEVSTINFQQNVNIANMIFVGVSSSRQIKFLANQSVHVIVDLTGTIG
ncbi:MAG: hypothetical protein ABWX96_00190 [Propionibacteriaceae bacterium]